MVAKAAQTSAQANLKTQLALDAFIAESRAADAALAARIDSLVSAIG